MDLRKPGFPKAPGDDDSIDPESVSIPEELGAMAAPRPAVSEEELRAMADPKPAVSEEELGAMAAPKPAVSEELGAMAAPKPAVSEELGAMAASKPAFSEELGAMAVEKPAVSEESGGVSYKTDASAKAERPYKRRKSSEELGHSQEPAPKHKKDEELTLGQKSPSDIKTVLNQTVVFQAWAPKLQQMGVSGIATQAAATYAEDQGIAVEADALKEQVDKSDQISSMLRDLKGFLDIFEPTSDMDEKIKKLNEYRTKFDNATREFFDHIAEIRKHAKRLGDAVGDSPGPEFDKVAELVSQLLIKSETLSKRAAAESHPISISCRSRPAGSTSALVEQFPELSAYSPIRVQNYMEDVEPTSRGTEGGPRIFESTRELRAAAFAIPGRQSGEPIASKVGGEGSRNDRSTERYSSRSIRRSAERDPREDSHGPTHSRSDPSVVGFRERSGDRAPGLSPSASTGRRDEERRSVLGERASHVGSSSRAPPESGVQSPESPPASASQIDASRTLHENINRLCAKYYARREGTEPGGFVLHPTVTDENRLSQLPYFRYDIHQDMESHRVTDLLTGLSDEVIELPAELRKPPEGKRKLPSEYLYLSEAIVTGVRELSEGISKLKLGNETKKVEVEKPPALDREPRVRVYSESDMYMLGHKYLADVYRESRRISQSSPSDSESSDSDSDGGMRNRTIRGRSEMDTLHKMYLATESRDYRMLLRDSSSDSESVDSIVGTKNVNPRQNWLINQKYLSGMMEAQKLSNSVLPVYSEKELMYQFTCKRQFLTETLLSNDLFQHWTKLENLRFKILPLIYDVTKYVADEELIPRSNQEIPVGSRYEAPWDDVRVTAQLMKPLALEYRMDVFDLFAGNVVDNRRRLRSRYVRKRIVRSRGDRAGSVDSVHPYAGEGGGRLRIVYEDPTSTPKRAVRPNYETLMVRIVGLRGFSLPPKRVVATVNKNFVEQDFVEYDRGRFYNAERFDCVTENVERQLGAIDYLPKILDHINVVLNCPYNKNIEHQLPEWNKCFKHMVRQCQVAVAVHMICIMRIWKENVIYVHAADDMEILFKNFVYRDRAIYDQNRT